MARVAALFILIFRFLNCEQLRFNRNRAMTTPSAEALFLTFGTLTVNTAVYG